MIKKHSDLGWLQWAAGTVNPYGSVTQGPDAIQLPGFPEISMFAQYVLNMKNYAMDMNVAKRLLNSTSTLNTKPLFDSNNVLEFLNV